MFFHSRDRGSPFSILTSSLNFGGHLSKENQAKVMMAHDLPSVGAGLASPPMTPINTTEKQATSTVNGDGGMAEGAAPSSETENVTVNVRYTVDCDYEDGPNFRVSKNDKPLDIQAKKEDETIVPVIEIFTHISVADIVKGKEDKKPSEGVSPTLDNKRVKRVGQEWLQIHSPVLSELLRSVVRYYPGQVFLSSFLVCEAPPPNPPPPHCDSRRETNGG